MLLAVLVFSASQTILGRVGAQNIWYLWWPQQALADNYLLAATDYASFSVENNLLGKLSLPSSMFFAGLDVFLSPVASYNSMAVLYVLLNVITTSYLIWEGTAKLVEAALGGLLIAVSPLNLLILEYLGVAALGFFVLPLSWIAWNKHHAGDWHWGWFVACAYLTVLMSLQFANLLVILVIFILIGLRHTWRTHQTALMWICVIMGVLLFLHPLPDVWQATYFSRFPALEILQASTPLWLTGAMLILLLLAAGLTYSQQQSVSMWMAWGAVVGFLVIFPDLAPLSVLAWLFNVPNVPTLTDPLIYLYAVYFAAVLLATRYLAGLDTQRLGYAAMVLVAIISNVVIAGQFPPTREAVESLDIDWQVADDPENYIILEFPPTASRLAAIPTHQKRLIDADYPLNRALIDQAAVMPEIQNQFMADTQLARIGYVVIHTQQVSDTQQTALNSILEGLYCPVHTTTDLTVWRARWHPIGCDNP